MKIVYITQQQLSEILLHETNNVLCEGYRAPFKGKLKKIIKRLLLKGIGVTSLIFALAQTYNIGYDEATQIVEEVQNEIKTPIQHKTDNTWVLIADNVLATVYNAEPKQCNSDITHTASMFRLNLKNVLSHRIIAMERTMMSKYGLNYGDVVKIEGTGKYDGVWQIQDTMNKRFAGQNKIDILIPKSAGLGKWENVKVYKLTNPEDKDKFKSKMAPQLSKADATAQIKQIKNGNFKLS